MAVLNVRNLNMTFVERTLFDNISFDVEERDKIGLVGANGVGKTTIFKIISGTLEQTGGSVFTGKNAVVGYMQQHACTHPNRCMYDELLSVFEPLMQQEKDIERLNDKIDADDGMGDSDDLIDAVSLQTVMQDNFVKNGGLTFRSRTRSALLGLGFSENDFNMPTGKLSGGQLSKISLAKLLLCGANVLLLDEPTNHLDITSVEWLEGFIKDFKGAVVIVSHDRYFLDAVTNKTIELEHNKITCYKGSYSTFLQKKEKLQEDLQKKYDNDVKEIKRIEGIVEQQKRWGQTRNYITAASKQKQADRLKEDLIAPENSADTIHFRFEPNRESGNDVLTCEGLSKSFGSKKLFDNVNIDIKRNERIFVLGANGCGKTTLFKILLNRLPADKGEINFGTNVDTGYFDQVQANLDLSKTALDEVWDDFPQMTQTQVRTALGSFLFKGDDVFKEQSTLSGGERARIALLKLMLQGSNFLLLDEPTNHLDTWSREALEDTLKDYNGTLLIVSHDRYFINKLADRILYLDQNGIHEYKGDYDYFCERQKLEKSAAATEKAAIKAEKPQVLEYKKRKEMQSKARKAKNDIKKFEDEIENLETQTEETQQLLSAQEIIADYEKLTELTNILQDLQQQLNTAYDNWGKADKELKELMELSE